MNSPEKQQGGVENQYKAHYSLGEHMPALEGVGLDIGDNNSVRLDASISESKTHVQPDKFVAGELLKQMREGAVKGDGNFIRKGDDYKNEFIFRATSDVKDPYTAIQKIMKSPEMQRVVKEREPAMRKAEEDRRKEVDRQNKIRAEEHRAYWKRRDEDEEVTQAGIKDVKNKIDKLT